MSKKAQECPDSTPEEGEFHWIEIELVDEDDNPVPGEEYLIELPDGSKARGRTDWRGRARIQGMDEGGQCKVSFPKLDKDAWEPA